MLVALGTDDLRDGRSCVVGGLSRSIVDDQGFTWDLGGHVIFSHYEYFDRLLDRVLGKGAEAWIEHERESWVWIRQRFVPYPFQNNLWRLPEEELVKCLEGLVDASRGPGAVGARTFEEWIRGIFGAGIAEIFMEPYNFKVWAHKPAQMGCSWMGERVATVDLKRALRNVVMRRDDLGWGPNARFRYPLRGGTGAIWSALGRALPAEHVHLGKHVTRIDAERHIVHFADGSSEPYARLISTLPLDLLIKMLDNLPASLNDADRALLARHTELCYSSSHIIGIGVAGAKPDSLATKCWMYFPEDDCPFYRATVFSNYSPYNVPRPGEQWSLMLEVSESRHKPVDLATVVQDTIQGCINTGLLPPGSDIVSRWHLRLEHGYPTPYLGRDELVDRLLALLRDKLDIWSRGRFGAWKYEVANQDHSCMQGVEAADNVLFGTEELTLTHPNVVNASKARMRTGVAFHQDY